MLQSILYFDLNIILELLPTLTPEQKLWLSGYLTASQQAETNESVTSNQIAQQLQDVLQRFLPNFGHFLSLTHIKL
jgi:hypothetical protein